MVLLYMKYNSSSAATRRSERLGCIQHTPPVNEKAISLPLFHRTPHCVHSESLHLHKMATLFALNLRSGIICRPLSTLHQYTATLTHCCIITALNGMHKPLMQRYDNMIEELIFLFGPISVSKRDSASVD